MKKEIIIDYYGLGNAVVVREEGEIIDCFIDPPKNVSFYPPNTFVAARVDRKVPNIGGYFVILPNGNQGFLKSKQKYNQGMTVLLMSQVVFEPSKPQTFTDILKSVSKYFVIKIGKKGFSFSKKIPQNFDRSRNTALLEKIIENFDDIFIVCRSSVSKIPMSIFEEELKKAVKHLLAIKRAIGKRQIYFDGLAKKVSMEKYRADNYMVTEEEGIFDRLGIWDQLEKIKEGNIQLKNDAHLIFEQTSAFISIDVNSGNNFKAKKQEINLAACNEIIRIIRAFGFGGKILIDFLPCSQELRNEIYRKILLSFSNDPTNHKIWGWTKSGIFELERKRDKIPFKLLF